MPLQTLIRFDALSALMTIIKKNIPVFLRFPFLFFIATLFVFNSIDAQQITPAGNPIVTDVYTADPAALVVGDTVYLYTGHDEAKPPHEGYVMHEWLCFSSPDMIHWTERGSPLNVKDFAWAKGDAWASQV